MINAFDIVLATHLCGRLREDWTFASLAIELSASVSVVHRSVKAQQDAGLYDPRGEAVRSEALLELLVHATKYLFPPRFGAPTRGMPTGPFAAPLAAEFGAVDTNTTLPWVWPFRFGDVAGTALVPLHDCVPAASAKFPSLYRRMALIDTLRAGRARDIASARRHLAIELSAESILERSSESESGRS